MQDNRTVQYVVLAIALVVAVIGSYFGINLPQPTIPTPAPQIGARVAGNTEVLRALIVENDTALQGDLAVTGVTSFAGAATFSGAVGLPAGDVSATEIADATRAVQIPLLSLIECTTDAGAAINFTDGADAFPDYAGNATDGLPFTLNFDDTGGSPDTARVCGQMIVPPDYASGGAFVVRAAKDAHTAGNSEVINCQGSVNGGTLSTLGTTAVTTSTIGAYTCTPTLTGLAAGASLGATLYITSSGTVDDVTKLYGVEFTYTATQ